jgi:hypothetical protein
MCNIKQDLKLNLTTFTFDYYTQDYLGVLEK